MLVSVKELFRNCEKYEMKEIVQGWIRTNRDQKEFGFINLNSSFP